MLSLKSTVEINSHPITVTVTKLSYCVVDEIIDLYSDDEYQKGYEPDTRCDPKALKLAKIGFQTQYMINEHEFAPMEPVNQLLKSADKRHSGLLLKSSKEPFRRIHYRKNLSPVHNDVTKPIKSILKVKKDEHDYDPQAIIKAQDQVSFEEFMDKFEKENSFIDPICVEHKASQLYWGNTDIENYERVQSERSSSLGSRNSAFEIVPNSKGDSETGTVGGFNDWSSYDSGEQVAPPTGGACGLSDYLQSPRPPKEVPEFVEAHDRNFWNNLKCQTSSALEWKIEPDPASIAVPTDRIEKGGGCGTIPMIVLENEENPPTITGSFSKGYHDIEKESGCPLIDPDPEIPPPLILDSVPYGHQKFENHFGHGTSPIDDWDPPRIRPLSAPAAFPLHWEPPLNWKPPVEENDIDVESDKPGYILRAYLKLMEGSDLKEPDKDEDDGSEMSFYQTHEVVPLVKQEFEPQTMFSEMAYEQRFFDYKHWEDEEPVNQLLKSRDNKHITMVLKSSKYQFVERLWTKELYPPHNEVKGPIKSILKVKKDQHYLNAQSRLEQQDQITVEQLEQRIEYEKTYQDLKGEEFKASQLYWGNFYHENYQALQAGNEGSPGDDKDTPREVEMKLSILENEAYNSLKRDQQRNVELSPDEFEVDWGAARRDHINSEASQTIEPHRPSRHQALKGQKKSILKIKEDKHQYDAQAIIESQDQMTLDEFAERLSYEASVRYKRAGFCVNEPIDYLVCDQEESERRGIKWKTHNNVDGPIKSILKRGSYCEYTDAEQVIQKQDSHGVDDLIERLNYEKSIRDRETLRKGFQFRRIKPMVKKQPTIKATVVETSHNDTKDKPKKSLRFGGVEYADSPKIIENKAPTPKISYSNDNDTKKWQSRPLVELPTDCSIETTRDIIERLWEMYAGHNEPLDNEKPQTSETYNGDKKPLDHNDKNDRTGTLKNIKSPNKLQKASESIIETDLIDHQLYKPQDNSRDKNFKVYKEPETREGSPKAARPQIKLMDIELKSPQTDSKPAIDINSRYSNIQKHMGSHSTTKNSLNDMDISHNMPMKNYTDDDYIDIEKDFLKFFSPPDSEMKLPEQKTPSRPRETSKQLHNDENLIVNCKTPKEKRTSATDHRALTEISNTFNTKTQSAGRSLGDQRNKIYTLPVPQYSPQKLHPFQVGSYDGEIMEVLNEVLVELNRMRRQVDMLEQRTRRSDLGLW